MGPLHFLVPEAESGERLDRALSSLADVTRAQARRWIDEGRVTLVSGGRPQSARPSRRVAEGDAIAADPPEVVPTDLVPEAIPTVLHEDADLIVIDKPAGLVVHPSPGHSSGTLVHALLHHCGDLAGIGGVRRPGIVHRLDRGTSGVLVAAKHDDAHVALAAQFRDHSVERVYLTVVRALPGADSGHIDRPIGRHPSDRKRMAVRRVGGREARTNWLVRERFAPAASARGNPAVGGGVGYALLEVRPETGRTHQIRVHLAALGLPIVGDPVYGRARRATAQAARMERPALHAAVLGFDHPRGGERMRFEAPPPADFAALLAELAERYGAAEAEAAAAAEVAATDDVGPGAGTSR